MNQALQDIVQDFRESLSDGVLTRVEKRILRKEIAAEGMTGDEKVWLLSQFKEIITNEETDQTRLNKINTFYEAAKLLKTDQRQRTSNSVFFSPGESCRDAIISHLRSASNSIAICVFTISDDYIADELEGALKRNINIRIISDQKKAHDRGSDVFYLQDKGIPIRFNHTDVHMHHKFAIIDDHTLTGSYNWTRTAAEENFENIFITDDKLAHQKFTSEFARLWQLFELP